MSTTAHSLDRLIDESVFAGRIYLDGEWIEGGGGEIASIEPATGETLAMVGVASAADVARAAEGAARAQR
ncbi:MAG: benzaldehyde dehydrogenase, partial [Microbacterium sp.]|nr:benzaldehyde dehydrogenase [Microbacterium sp.]